MVFIRMCEKFNVQIQLLFNGKIITVDKIYSLITTFIQFKVTVHTNFHHGTKLPKLNAK